HLLLKDGRHMWLTFAAYTFIIAILFNFLFKHNHVTNPNWGRASIIQRRLSFHFPYIYLLKRSEKTSLALLHSKTTRLTIGHLIVFKTLDYLTDMRIS